MKSLSVLFESGRQSLQQQHGALGGERLVVPGDDLDLGDGLFDSGDRRLELPSARVPAESGAEPPLVSQPRGSHT